MKTLSRNTFIVPLCIIVLAVVSSCVAPTQRKAFNTIASIETGATSSVDLYFTLVIQGKAPTNGVPTVTRAYNALQQSVKLSLTAVQGNSNALAPDYLLIESVDLANLITQAKGK